MTLSLAFLAPDIVKAAIDGRLPRGFGLKRLVDLPMSWSDQWRVLGLRRQRVPKRNLPNYFVARSSLNRHTLSATAVGVAFGGRGRHERPA
jgi:hypothetical protein